jgi:hypothetical protein
MFSSIETYKHDQGWQDQQLHGKKKSKKNIFSSFNKNQQRTVKILKKIKKGFFFVSLISFYKDIN